MSVAPLTTVLLYEVLGTATLLLLGCGVVANVTLAERGQEREGEYLDKDVPVDDEHAPEHSHVDKDIPDRGGRRTAERRSSRLARGSFDG